MKISPDRILEHVRRLAVEIGCRPIGSPSNLAAAEYIADVFRGTGLTVEMQDFDSPDWIAESASLVLDGESLEACANSFSPSCDIVAPILPVCTLAQLEAASLGGKLLVFYGSLAQSELATKRGIYIPDRDRRVIELLEKYQPAGLVTINPTLHARWRLIEDFDLNIPSVTVTAPSGLKLLKCSGATAKMTIAARRAPSHSANVIGTLRGRIAERIAFCAHYDTKVDTPGAYDNATGVAALLTLAGLLSQAKHRHTFEFIAFSGEEGAGLGDMEYARRLPDGFDQITALLNFDGIGPFTGTTTAAIFAASPSMEAALDGLIARHPGVIKVDPWPASDHYIFYSHSTPSVAFTSMGIRDVYHTPSDTMDWISGEKLVEVVRLALELVDELDDHELPWARPEAARSGAAAYKKST